MTPSRTATPFKFNQRRDSVDWRRIHEVDVDLVVSQVDVHLLQEHIGMVTFCRLEGECCLRCRNPVDSCLVKLFRLAQLSLQWFMHSQEILVLNLGAAKERLEAGDREHQQLLGQLKKQGEKEKALVGELKRRKNILRSQQSMMLTKQNISIEKCQHCEKSFLNSSFLQNHMQRRHPEEYDIQRMFDMENKSVITSLKSELSKLKKELHQQRQAFEAKIIEAKVHQPASQKKSVCSVYSQTDMDIYKEMQIHTIQLLEKQDKAWESRMLKMEALQEDSYKSRMQEMEAQQAESYKSRLEEMEAQQEMEAQHEYEKNKLLEELSQTQMNLSSENQRMHQRLQNYKQVIRAQKEQISILSNTPSKVVEVPVFVSSHATGPDQMRVVLDSSSLSEKRTSVRKYDPAPEEEEEEEEEGIIIVQSRNQINETSLDLIEKTPLSTFIEDSDSEVEEEESLRQSHSDQSHNVENINQGKGKKVNGSARKISKMWKNVFRRRRRSTKEEPGPAPACGESSPEWLPV